MKKLISLFSIAPFWSWFLSSAIIIVGLETFLLGLWPLPVLNYQISYMEKITPFDSTFIILFALLFGFGIALFALSKKQNASACPIISTSGILGFFTLLCPICPIFFLTYFGVSAYLSLFAPYFWWIRGLSFLLLSIGIIILWKKFRVPELPKIKKRYFLQGAAAFMIIVLFFINQLLMINIGRAMLGPQPGENIKLSGNFGSDISMLVTPTTLPFYGSELGLDFSSVSAINASLSKLGIMAPKQGQNPIELTDAEMKRYIKIGTEPTITCEFCCGVKTLVREDGSPTCGCAHSIAMRGTTAYLIRNHPQMTDKEISYELVRQKGLYFPKQMQERMAKELSGNVADFTPDIRYLLQNLNSQELSNLQKKSQESGFKPKVNAPGMVGGC